MLVLAVVGLQPNLALQTALSLQTAIGQQMARLSARQPAARQPAVMMAARKPPGRQARAPSEEKKGLDATLPSLLYYGCYSFFFGKMLLVVVERIGSGV